MFSITSLRRRLKSRPDMLPKFCLCEIYDQFELKEEFRYCEFKGLSH